MSILPWVRRRRRNVDEQGGDTPPDPGGLQLTSEANGGRGIGLMYNSAADDTAAIALTNAYFNSSLYDYCALITDDEMHSKVGELQGEGGITMGALLDPGFVGFPNLRHRCVFRHMQPALTDNDAFVMNIYSISQRYVQLLSTAGADGTFNIVVDGSEEAAESVTGFTTALNAGTAYEAIVEFVNEGNDIRGKLWLTPVGVTPRILVHNELVTDSEPTNLLVIGFNAGAATDVHTRVALSEVLNVFDGDDEYIDIERVGT